MPELKRSTGFKTLDRELRKDKYKGVVESFSNENSGRYANDGYWLYLEGYCGYHNDGRHSIHEWTISELIEALRDIRPCNCKQCQNNETIWSKNRIHKN